jgi:hypothetical protein
MKSSDRLGKRLDDATMVRIDQGARDLLAGHEYKDAAILPPQLVGTEEIPL